MEASAENKPGKEGRTDRWRVRLVRSGSKSKREHLLGFTNLPDAASDGSPCLRVTEVTPCSLLAEWNAQWPHLAVAAGDCVVAVNGIHGNVFEMRSLLDTEVVDLLVEKEASPAPFFARAQTLSQGRPTSHRILPTAPSPLPAWPSSASQESPLSGCSTPRGRHPLESAEDRGFGASGRMRELERLLARRTSLPGAPTALECVGPVDGAARPQVLGPTMAPVRASTARRSSSRRVQSPDAETPRCGGRQLSAPAEVSGREVMSKSLEFRACCPSADATMGDIPHKAAVRFVQALDGCLDMKSLLPQLSQQVQVVLAASERKERELEGLQELMHRQQHEHREAAASIETEARALQVSQRQLLLHVSEQSRELEEMRGRDSCERESRSASEAALAAQATVLRAQERSLEELQSQLVTLREKESCHANEVTALSALGPALRVQEERAIELEEELAIARGRALEPELRSHALAVKLEEQGRELQELQEQLTSASSEHQDNLQELRQHKEQRSWERQELDRLRRQAYEEAQASHARERKLSKQERHAFELELTLEQREREFEATVHREEELQVILRRAECEISDSELHSEELWQHMAARMSVEAREMWACGQRMALEAEDKEREIQELHQEVSRGRCSSMYELQREERAAARADALRASELEMSLRLRRQERELADLREREEQREHEVSLLRHSNKSQFTEHENELQEMQMQMALRMLNRDSVIHRLETELAEFALRAKPTREEAAGGLQN